MGKIGYGVRYRSLGPLTSLVPCTCNQNPYKDATYFVDTKTSSTYVYGTGPKLTYVYIKCQCCGSETRCDVENMDIYERDLPF